MCHYLPLRSDGSLEEAKDDVDDSSEEEDDAIDMVGVELPEMGPEEDKPQGAEGGEARGDLRLMHLRKGFRLSSMCWDE